MGRSDELGRLDALLAGAERAEPGLDSAVEHGDVVVAEVAKEPPEPRGPAVHPLVVGDDERVVTDPCRLDGPLEVLRRGQRVTPALRPAGRRRELRLDVQEGRTRDVPGQVELTAGPRLPELPPAIDKLHPHVAGG